MLFVLKLYLRKSLLLAFASGLLFLVPLRSGAEIGVSYQLLLGNPTGAIADTNNHNHFLIQRTIYALDYNDTHREPNWVSWCLSASDQGSSGRTGTFFQDSSLPANFYQVKTSDYSGSGYDRGHMCPSADRTDTVADNETTFLMSNMIPQAPDNNQGVWANLENYCRALSQTNDCLIISGPEGFDGSRTASSGLIYIPSNVWKLIIVVPPGPGNIPDRITPSNRVIAVSIPNIAGVRTTPWQNFLTSINQLQTNTGFTFLTAIDSNIAPVLRAKIDGTPAPNLNGFTPNVGLTTTTVTLTGVNLASASSVSFNGVNTSFTINSATSITATVPVAATTGPISVITAGGLAVSSGNFTVTPSTNSLPPPLLAITLAGDTAVLSWPSSASDYFLQQNPDLNPANWTNYLGTTSDDGSSKSATITTSGVQMFFRLARP